MPIDLTTVDWIYVVILGIFVFLAALIGGFLGLGHRGYGALFAAVIFVALFVAWTYYPHGLPLPTRPGQTTAAVSTSKPSPSPQAAPAAPQRPANPVTTIYPPPAVPPPAAPAPDSPAPSPPPAAPRQ